MLRVHYFTFNPFQENTFVLWDDASKEAAIVDAGNSTSSEHDELERYVKQNALVVKQLLNTHAHIDHVLDNAWVLQKWKVPFLLHEEDLPVLHSLSQVASMYGLPAAPSPEPTGFLNDHDEIMIGNEKLKVLFVPGHAPGHVAFYHEKQKLLINGDVLFNGSIGRTDLPGGDYDTLMKSITEKILTLPDDVKIYCGHGPETTVKKEKATNPFVLEYLAER
ncbi:MAG TPA: MBL fold metallo-hydrolase [Chitinophagales bacterium]|nr:MBL fold metallo-hydrolase [Chitinophagales bacterium]